MLRISRQTKILAFRNCFIYNKSTHLNTFAHQYDLKMNIHSKNDFMDELNKLSIRITNTFETSSYMNPTKSFWLNQLGSHKGFKQNYERLISFDLNVKTLKQLVDFTNENFEQLTIKEKSIIFRLISVIHSFDPKYFKLIQRLEIDFYYNIENCDLVDLNNFYSGMSIYRSCTKHFMSKTLDHAMKSINEIITNDKEVSKDLFFREDVQFANEINKKWLNQIDYKNDVLFSIYMLRKLSNYLADITIINRNLLSNGYIIDQIKTENIENISEKLAIYSYFHSTGHSLATNKFYSDLYNSNLINNLNKIQHPLNEKHYLKFIINKNLSDTSKDNSEIIFKLAEHLSTKLNETSNIYKYCYYLSSLSLLLSSRNFASPKMLNDFKNYNSKYEKLFKKFIRSIDEKEHVENNLKEIKKTEIDALQSIKLLSLRNKYKYNAQEKIKSFKRSDLDLYLIFELVSLKRIYDPFYWISKNTISHIFTNIIENIQVYHQSDFSVLIKILERISDSYPESEIPEFILNHLYSVIIDTKSTYLSKATKIPILKIILRNKELISNKINLIYQIIIDDIIDNCLIDDVVYISKSLIKNITTHSAQNKTKTSDIFNKAIELIVKDLSDIDTKFMSDEKAKTTLEISVIIRELHKSKELIEINKFKIDINELKLKKNQMIDNFHQLNMKDTNNEIDNEIKKLEKFFFNYSSKLKCLCELSMACNQFDKDLFYEAMISCVQILTIFEKTMFAYEKSGSVNTIEYILKSRRFVTDILTCYGVFDYFDINNFLKMLNEEELKIFKYSLLKLEETNDHNYSILNNYFQKNTMSLIKYTLSMQNLKFSNSQALEALFQKNITVENIIQKLNIDRENDVLFAKKLLFAINVIGKCKHESLPFLFNNNSITLPNKNQESIFEDLVKMFGKDYVGKFPVFEHNLVSDFELTTNEAGEMVKPSEKEKVKLRIPIYVIDNTMMYNPSFGIYSPILAYIECLKQFHPVVLINSEELNKDSFNKRQEYLFSNMQKSIANHLNKNKN